MARLLLSSLCFTVVVTNACQAQYDHLRLKKLADKEIAQGAVEFVPPTIRFEGNIMAWSLGSALIGPAGEDVVTHAVEEQFRVAIIRHERRNRKQRQFWKPVLRDVEGIIREELEYTKRVRTPDEARIAKYRDRIVKIYSRAMEEYAASKGYTARREERKAARVCRIKFILPGASTVDVIYRTRYKLLSLNPGVKIIFSAYQTNAKITLRAGAYFYRRTPNGPIRQIKIVDHGTYRL